MDPRKNQNFLKLSATPMSTNGLRTSDAVHVMDEEAMPDVDEPPDEALVFRRQPIRSPSLPGMLTPTGPGYTDQKPRQQSLLTRGLLTITKASQRDHVPPGPQSARSTQSIGSIASTAELTSDGGLTSPARTSTPSPPFPPANVHLLAINDPKKQDVTDALHPPLVLGAPAQAPPAEQPRKRCITFACARPTSTKPETTKKPIEPAQPVTSQRCTTLKFACPAKPVREPVHGQDQKAKRFSKSPRSDAKYEKSMPTKHAPLDDKDDTPKKESSSKISSSTSPKLAKKHRPEALRFHEFASPRLEDDEWTRVKPTNERKITVNDTLKKEHAIRKLGEEAEAEALEEEREEEENDANSENDEDEDAERFENDDEYDFSDGGNETDDEEGFAASDDESEADPEYQFWTPGVTTGIASADQPEHIRPKQKRSASGSSIESAIYNNSASNGAQRPVPKGRRQGRSIMRPSTPELPDSTDFVCGTLDEDRPLEAAYMSCLEQRKLSKHGITPQDLDPSFPTSDPEQDDSDDDQGAGSESQVWVIGKPDESDSDYRRGRQARTSKPSTRASSGISPKRKVSPAPRRCKSPAPLANVRGVACRSPPPRRLFGHSPRRLHSPPPRNPASPPCSRRPSYNGKNIAIPYLAQQPNLTHTKSLPKTPNPFWQEHRRLQMKDSQNRPAGIRKTGRETCSRGPIDVVQGLEKKRQRRKEKFWLTHYRHGAKDKDRRCQPGRGAQRMREVGLEMADRCKGFGHRLQVVLSV